VRYEDTKSTTSVRTMGQMIRALWQIRQAWRADVRMQPLPEPAQVRQAA
jgi:hypothetical protein